MTHRIFTVLFTLAFNLTFIINLSAQETTLRSSSEIYNAMLKLGNTATVMYVAAHPDDENTRLISWLTNHRHVNTVYLSLTRGDGGQNLIGTEKGPLLGVLRTQELLKARSIDGGKQFFSRAIDFGYSKTATETRKIWDEEEILKDVVWAIRVHRPEILINRFDHNSNGKTHGHHTLSAILSLEAFEKAGDPSVFPEQLKYVRPWSPKAVYFNTSWWFYGSKAKFEKADKSEMIQVDIGAYDPVTGYSNNEIAALSRSSHRCQGFGATRRRGSTFEYLQFVKGNKPDFSENDLLYGVNQSWTRIKGGEGLEAKTEELAQNFDFKNPEKSLPQLLEIYDALKALPDAFPIKHQKLEETLDLLQACSGLYLEATCEDEILCPSDSTQLRIEMVNRGKADISAQFVGIHPGKQKLVDKTELKPNQKVEETIAYQVDKNIDYTSPYWLKKPSSLGMFKVEDQEKIGLPENPAALRAEFRLKINDREIAIKKPVVYTRTDPSYGQTYQPIAIVPKVTLRFEKPVFIFPDESPQRLAVKVSAHTNNLNGKVFLKAKGWNLSEPQELTIKKKGEETTLHFAVSPPTDQMVSDLLAYMVIGKDTFRSTLHTVEYEHIPTQHVLLPAKVKLNKLNIKTPTLKVAYLQGAGDEIPEQLKTLNIDVREITLDDLEVEKLKNYDAVVLGIRAFNVLEPLEFKQKELWGYVKQGGTVIEQYNTSRRLNIDISPLPLKLGRDRITEEEAELKILKPDHQIFNYPNKITQKDFEGWVQERGLYFASEWDDAFTPLLEGHDVDEENKKGMLLVSNYGKGTFVYTGISFFRQLPAGVPGAFRLFVNILAAGENSPN